MGVGTVWEGGRRDMVHVFVSYRRDSDSYRAAMLRMIVVGAFSREPAPSAVSVFLDTRQRPGVDSPKELRAELDRADVVLAVIGPEWLSAKDKYARRRIDQPDDWVRQELEIALASDTTVLPVVFETTLPEKEALPDSIQALPDQVGVLVRRDSTEGDLQPVLAEIERHLDDPPRRSQAERPGSGQLPYPDPPLTIVPAPLS